MSAPAKHTPGPWHRGAETAAAHQINGPRGEYVATVYDVQAKAPGSLDRTAEANARLIASAPDLLDACDAAAAALRAIVNADDAGDESALLDAIHNAEATLDSDVVPAIRRVRGQS